MVRCVFYKARISPLDHLVSQHIYILYLSKLEVAHVMYNYVDKNGRQIKSGYMISISGNKPEMVYSTVDQFGRKDLSVNASNEDYLKNPPDTTRQYYSLSNFTNSEIEIVKRPLCKCKDPKCYGCYLLYPKEFQGQKIEEIKKREKQKNPGCVFKLVDSNIIATEKCKELHVLDS